MIYGYLQGTLSPDERVKLEEWLDDNPENEILFDRICDQKNILNKARFFDKHPQEKMWNSLEKKIFKKKKRTYPLYWSIAASLMIPLFIGTWFLMSDVKSDGKEEKKYEILSGTACAQLELFDGTVIDLHQDSVYSMELAQGERLDNKGGIVSYKQDSVNVSVEEYNEIKTPRGGEYQILLPDGDKSVVKSQNLRYGFRGSFQKKRDSCMHKGSFILRLLMIRCARFVLTWMLTR